MTGIQKRVDELLEKAMAQPGVSDVMRLYEAPKPAIAAWLANHAEFKMHGKYINRDKLREHRLNIVNLEDDKDEQEFVLSMFHATTHTFTNSKL